MSTQITDEDLSRFRELRAKASPGPWNNDYFDMDNMRAISCDDMEFIMQAAAHWDALLDEIGTQRNRIAALEGCSYVMDSRVVEILQGLQRAGPTRSMLATVPASLIQSADTALKLMAAGSTQPMSDGDKTAETAR